MIWLKSNSLERYLNWRLGLLIMPILFGGIIMVYYLALPLWLTIITSILLLLVCINFILHIKNTILKAYERASLHLDAIKQEDYHQYGKTTFKQGKVGEFHQQLNELSQRLQWQKSRYDQHAFLVYQLITQLDTPVLVLNEKQQLNFGNDGFYQLFKQPWQMYRHSSPARLGLTKSAKQWQFINSEHNQQWQIRHSEFIDNGESHQLLIFIDIGSAIRTSQLNAWQQIIRVLGHEIRNSLAPVSSLSESLADKSANERDKTALNVITERCQHLQTFVERYASLSKPLSINQQWLSVTQFLTPIIALYPQLTITTKISAEKNTKINNESSFETSAKQLWADKTLLAQVIINLLKNSQEAEATTVEFNFSQQQQHYQITLIDNGHGFSNLDNLFVPLYSTKPQGQGIGLNFCRNIIEQHQGTLTLTNNNAKNDSKNKNSAHSQGVILTLLLPIPLVHANKAPQKSSAL